MVSTHRPGKPQPERQQPCVQHAYDPSRDLSPNLPHSHHQPHPHDSATRLPCDRLDPFNNNNNNSHDRPASAMSGGMATPLICDEDHQGCHQCGHHQASASSSCSSTASSAGGGGALLRPKQERPCSPASSDVGGPGSTTTTELEAAGPCAGCGQRISDRFYLLAVDRRWHAACLQCCSCRHALDGEVTCFSRDGNIYCKKDYYRLFGMKRCARCQAAISSSELVMRARELVFHVACFTCALCHAPLSKGDHFGLREGAVLCRLHYEALPPASPTPAFPPPPPGSEGGFSPVPPPASFRAVPPSPQGMSPSGGGGGGGLPPGGLSGALPPGAAMMPLGPHGPLPGGMPHMGLPHGGPGGPDPKLPFFNGGVPQVVAPGPRQKGRPRKRKPKEMEGITAAMGDMGGDSYLDGPFGPGTPGLHGNSRSKRMRTSFKHHQLRTMKSYFAINHNPDAKDLKQLSQKTGLPKRVLQVWFQNARAKWRRLMLKQEGKGGDKCGGDSPGDMDHGFAGAMGGAHGPGGPHSPQFILGGSPLEC